MIKKDGLLIYGGEDLVNLEDVPPDPTGQEGDYAYKILIRKIDNHFIPKKKKDYARFQLSELKQQSHKLLADYYPRVQDIANKSDYGTHEEDMIRYHLIQTMLSKVIRENWVLDRILTKAALDKQTTEQAGAMSKRLDDKRSSQAGAMSKRLDDKRSSQSTRKLKQRESRKKQNTAFVGSVEIRT